MFTYFLYFCLGDPVQVLYKCTTFNSLILDPIKDKIYGFLVKEMKKKRPDKEAVSKYLDQEYKYRRSWISSTLEKRLPKVLERYPCFSNFHHVCVFNDCLKLTLSLSLK